MFTLRYFKIGKKYSVNCIVFQIFTDIYKLSLNFSMQCFPILIMCIENTLYSCTDTISKNHNNTSVASKL